MAKQQVQLFAALLLGSALISSCSAPGTQADKEGQATYSTQCPSGFANALESSMRNTKSASTVAADSLGLGELEPRIACAVRTVSSISGGVLADNDSYYTVVVMQADVTEMDVTDALEGLGFVKDLAWGREDAAPGTTESAHLMTYGEISNNLTGNSPKWNRFRAAFPSESVVLGAVVRRSKAESEGVWSSERRSSAPRPAWRWFCSYSPTYNRDWHDDVICTNGRDSDRPYLRPSDGFITYGEIMRSAGEYERHLNGE